MRFAILLPVIAAALLTAGGRASAQQTTEPEGPNAKTISGIGRIRERPEVQNHMKQLGLFYRTYITENGVLKDPKAFKDYIRRDAPRIAEQLDANHYVVVPNLRDPGSNQVVAFERIGDVNDRHVVVMGDGSVHEMSTAQLRGALKKE